MLKISVSLVQNTAFDQAICSRHQQHTIAEICPAISVASPEDVILTQLQEYRASGEIADDQWNDILGVLKVQGKALDFAYLHHWADNLNIADLLEQACVDAGIRRPSTD